MSSIFTRLFEKFPEIPLKNSIRYFLAFNRFVPRFISDVSPIKGYELYYNLKKGDVVVDAGAFTGDYTVFASRKVGKTGKVIAFEPDEKNRIILRKNLRKELDNVIIVPKGLWNKNTTLRFNDKNGLHSTVFTDKGESKLEVVKLDDELSRLNIKKINFLKMDIEGAEIEAIKGCTKTLQENKANIAIASYHIVEGKQTSIFLENFLKKLGYEVKSDFSKHLTTYAWKA